MGIENLIFSEFSRCKIDNIDIQDKDQLLNTLKDVNISCKDVTLKILGLSLATINLMISLTILVLGIIYLKYGKNK